MYLYAYEAELSIRASSKPNANGAVATNARLCAKQDQPSKIGKSQHIDARPRLLSFQ